MTLTNQIISHVGFRTAIINACTNEVELVCNVHVALCQEVMHEIGERKFMDSIPATDTVVDIGQWKYRKALKIRVGSDSSVGDV